MYNVEEDCNNHKMHTVSPKLCVTAFSECIQLSRIKKYGSTSYLGMAQVQNGRLYIRYRSNSQKNEAEE